MSPEFLSQGMSPEQRLVCGDVVLARELLARDEIENEAHSLLAIGVEQPKKVVENEYKHNAITGLFERITASGHLSEVTFDGDQTYVHQATVQRIINSFMQPIPAWDKERYFQELCEELTIGRVFELIKSGVLPKDTKIMTISDFPEDPVADSEKHGQGYRTLNKKGMLRSYHFVQNDDESWTRVLEQLSRSQSNDNSTRRWFNENATAVPLHSTGALAEQFLVSPARLADGVVTLATELDAIYGTDRLYGEVISDALSAGRPDYANVRQESRAWRDQLQQYTSELEAYENQLHAYRSEGRISYNQHLRLFHQKIDAIIQRVLLLAPQFAEDTYGIEAAPFVHEASLAFAAGNYLQATQFLQQAEARKDERASTGCGGMGTKEDELSPLTSPSEAVNAAINDKKNWKWKQGVCAVKSCPTRPGKTKVGPCSVCTSCQHKFDQGKDPTKIKVSTQETVTNDEPSFVIAALFAANKKRPETVS